MERFNVLIQAYQHLKIHETLCCIIMKLLTECKHTDVMWPKSAAPIRPEFEPGIYEFTWPIYEFELGNSDFQAFWNAALGLIHTTRVHAVHERKYCVPGLNPALSHVQCDIHLSVIFTVDSRLTPAGLYSAVIHRVKWCHISMVAVRSTFYRSRPSYCA